jgi:FkbM family methyltransferase
MEYKSQVGQDRWVISKTNGKYNGYFLDIGASDGITINNSYVLEKEYDWQGICVESDKELFKTLTLNRSCVCVNVAIYSENTTVQFVSEPYKGIKSCIQIASGDVVDVKDAITMGKLLTDNNAPEYIDYISLDIEGADYDALLGFPFDKYKVGLWTIEHNAYMDNGILRDKIRGIMEEHGYKVVRGISTDVTFFEDWYEQI